MLVGIKPNNGLKLYWNLEILYDLTEVWNKCLATRVDLFGESLVLMPGGYVTIGSQLGNYSQHAIFKLGKKLFLQISRNKLNLHGLKRRMSHIPIQNQRSIGRKAHFPPWKLSSVMTQVPSLSLVSRRLSPLIGMCRWWLIFNTTDCNEWRKNCRNCNTDHLLLNHIFQNRSWLISRLGNWTLLFWPFSLSINLITPVFRFNYIYLHELTHPSNSIEITFSNIPIAKC